VPLDALIEKKPVSLVKIHYDFRGANINVTDISNGSRGAPIPHT